MTAPFRGSGPWRGRGPFLGRGPWAGKAPFGFNAGLPFAINVTGAQLRDALATPSAWGTTGSATGWLLPGLGGARLSGDCRTSVAMQTAVDGTVGYAAHNLLPLSEGTWPNETTAATISTSAEQSPLVSNSARTITANAGTGFHYVRRPIGAQTGPVTCSFWLKKGTSRWAWVSVEDTSLAYFDFDTETWGELGLGLTVTATALANGWRKLTVTKTLSAQAPTAAFGLASGIGGAGGNFTATGTETVLVAGAQLNLGPTALPYVPTTAAARYGPAIDWLSGIGAYGIRSEAARTNSVRNSVAAGAVAGTPGTMPTNWGILAGVGLSRTDTPNTTLLGMPAHDMRFFGTASSTASLRISFEVLQAVAATGQTWATSLYVQLIAGSLSGTERRLSLYERDAAGAYLTNTTGADYVIDTTPVRMQYAGVLGNAGTLRVVGELHILLTNAVAYDFTLRIAAPQLELGTEASSPILTYGAAATRAADTLVVLDSGWINQTEGTLVVNAMWSGGSALPANSRHAAALENGASTDRLRIYNINGTAGGVYSTAGGVEQIAGINGTPATSAEVRSAVGIAANNVTLATDGTVRGTDTSVTLPAVNRLSLGGHANGGELNGHLTRIRYSRRRANDGTLRSLTT